MVNLIRASQHQWWSLPYAHTRELSVKGATAPMTTRPNAQQSDESHSVPCQPPQSYWLIIINLSHGVAKVVPRSFRHKAAVFKLFAGPPLGVVRRPLHQ